MSKIFIILFHTFAVFKFSMSVNLREVSTLNNNNSGMSADITEVEEEVQFLVELRGEPTELVDGIYLNTLCRPWAQQFHRDPEQPDHVNMVHWLHAREGIRAQHQFEAELEKERERYEKAQMEAAEKERLESLEILENARLAEVERLRVEEELTAQAQALADEPSSSEDTGGERETDIEE